MSGSAAPRVLLSRGALAQNARALFAGGGIADLRFDAYGHGLDEAARIVSEAGATSVLVSSAEEAARLTASGIRIAADGEQAADVNRLFGIPVSLTAMSVPVMTLQGRVLSTKPLRAGEAVSYGYTHRAVRDTRVALVTGGYAQGILRALGNRAHVQVGDRTHPIVGRIAMDVCVVDLEGADADIDTPVVFFGRGQMRDGLRRWAETTGLTAWEMAVVIGQNGERSWQA